MFASNNIVLPQKAKELCNKVKQITYFYIALIIIRFICGDFSVLWVDSLIILMIFISLSSVDSLTTAWTIFLVIMAVFNSAIIVLLFIQDHILGFSPTIFNLYFILQTAQLVIYILFIQYSFKIYKEYRYINEHTMRNDYRNIVII
jgi:hypothetical protein